MPDGDVKEGQVGVDIQRLLVFFDGLAIIAGGFEIIAIDPVDIHHCGPSSSAGWIY